MVMKLENYTPHQYADLACYCNQHNMRMEIIQAGVLAYALEENEIIVEGEVIDLREDETYIQNCLDEAKQRAKLSINKSYENALKFGIFQISNNVHANCAWETMWQKVVNVYTNLPAIGQVPPETFGIRLYTKVNGEYRCFNKTDTTIQELKNLLTLLVSQVMMNYQPKRDALFSALEAYYKDRNLEGINSIINLTSNLGGFGDYLDEVTEGNPEYV